MRIKLNSILLCNNEISKVLGANGLHFLPNSQKQLTCKSETFSKHGVKKMSFGGMLHTCTMHFEFSSSGDESGNIETMEDF